MISDILSDAIAEIKKYLDETDFYANMPPLTEELIYNALETMEIARINLDTLPKETQGCLIETSKP